jgi:hypothetical protein
MLALVCLIAMIGIVVVAMARFAVQPVRDLAWYRRVYPYCTQDDRLLCCRCGSERIGTQPLSTHLQQHVCELCSAVLFESGRVLRAESVMGRGCLLETAE